MIAPTPEPLPAYRLAFAWAFDGGFQSLHLLDLGGGRRTRLTHPSQGFDDHPAWSPDASRLAFTRCGPLVETLVVAADGSGERSLANHPATNPTWSPDGGRIAFVRQADTATPTICVVDADGTNVHEIAEGTLPSWGPDGRIAFLRETDAGWSLHVMGGDGSDLRRLTHASEGGGPPAWSPDGTRIALTRGPQADDGVFVVAADGSTEEPLPGSRYFDLSPTWSPDGERIAFIRLGWL
ncbi:MAG: hypothetical protein E6J41_21290 [Chloroflexi bacterium]|nr:MAG: hypothetical protein E6J41_21290 [Chloroflexota bacterium]